MKTFICHLFLAFSLLPACTLASRQEFALPDTLMPIPPAEQGLPTALGRPLATISQAGDTLEGVIYDKNGNLFFCNPTARQILRLAPDGQAQVIYTHPSLAPSGLAFHKDGRLFFTALNLQEGHGAIMALAPDLNATEIIIPIAAGYLPNDLVFDARGGFYFTDFSGSATRADGGVYYASPDTWEITSVIPHMAQANGVALSPDGQILWATEYANNRLHRAILADAVHVPPTGSKIAYNFIGPAPDSMRVDADGNVYVAMVGQGKVMIFNQAGLPIGQILAPGRDEGMNLRTTSLAIHPDKKEAAIVCGNTADAASKDATILVSPAFAHGQKP